MDYKEFRTERTHIISRMLDNPDKYGLYPTAICFEELDNLYYKIIKENKKIISNDTCWGTMQKGLDDRKIRISQ